MSRSWRCSIATALSPTRMRPRPGTLKPRAKPSAPSRIQRSSALCSRSRILSWSATTSSSRVSIMDHNLAHTIALLTRTPASLDALLRDLPEMWTLRNEGGESWTVFDIVGHLIHGDRTDWVPRVKMILEFGETRAFEPFDRLGQAHANQGKSLGQLLDEFAGIRS